MVTNLNLVVLAGRIVKDTVIEQTKTTGKNYVRFTLAFSTSMKNGDKYEAKSNFIDLTLFGNYATSLQPYLKKGQYVEVTGHMEQVKWESNGTTHYSYRVIPDDVKLVGTTKHDEAGQQDEPVNIPEQPPVEAEEISFDVF